MKTLSQIMTRAHEIARTLEGNYTARLSEGMKQAWSESKQEIKTYEFETKNKVRFGASKAQFNYLASFSNVEINVFCNRFCNYMTKQQASEMIDKAKQGVNVLIW